MTKDAWAQLRLASLGLLIASILIGCGKKDGASSTAATSGISDTAASAKGSAEAPSATERGEDAPAAAISAADPVALWTDVRSEETELGEVIQAAQLGKVHHLAFAIRDRVIALDKEHGSMAKDPAAMRHYVELIRTMAGNLDEYGDQGDLDKTQAEFAKCQATLRAVESAFPAGMLVKQ